MTGKRTAAEATKKGRAVRRRAALEARYDKAVEGCVKMWERQLGPSVARMGRSVDRVSAARDGVRREREAVSAAGAPEPVLAPRLRKTLGFLLGGQDMKGVARRLGLSRHTVHLYVTEIYRAYGVHSRAELMARCLGRDGRPGGGSSE